MKKNMKSSSILLGGLFLLGAVCSCTQTAPDYASYVNPFIGTGGHGHTYPGAVVPNGMIQPSPDTRIYEWDACSGYYYADTTINGFSHTHVSGTGCADYGDVLLMPTVGRQDYHSMGSKSQQMAYASAFSHENETAEPGYYSVFLGPLRGESRTDLYQACGDSSLHLPEERKMQALSSTWITASSARRMNRWSWK